MTSSTVLWSTAATTLAVATLVVATAYQTAVYLYLARHLFRYSPPRSGAQEGVSVIVCARNERENLEALLPIVLAQQYALYEVIIADDASDDGTRKLIAHYQQECPRLKTVRIDVRPTRVQPKKHALTEAIRTAQYDRLLLTDADCRPASEYWLATMTRPLVGSTNIVLGYSPYYHQPGWLNRWIRYETLHTGFLYTAAALAGHPYMSVGRNLAYSKLFFMEQGGFQSHETVVGGDDDLWVNEAARPGQVAVVLEKDALVYSVPETNWQDYLRQKTRHLRVGQHYQTRDQLWLGALSLSTVLIWLSGIILLFLCNKCDSIVALFLLRWLILAAVWKVARSRLHDAINPWLLPILDFLHVIYYVVVGTMVLTTKHIRWKN